MPVFSLNQRQRKYLEDFDLQHSYYSVSIQYELYWEKFRYDTTLTQLELIHHLTTRQVRNYSEGWAIKCTITTRETQQEINIEKGIYSFCTSTRTVQVFEGDITKIQSSLSAHDRHTRIELRANKLLKIKELLQSTVPELPENTDIDLHIAINTNIFEARHGPQSPTNYQETKNCPCGKENDF